MDNYFVCVVRRYRSEAHNIKPRSIDCSNLNYGTKFADSHAPSSIGYSIEPYINCCGSCTLLECIGSPYWWFVSLNIVNFQESFTSFSLWHYWHYNITGWNWNVEVDFWQLFVITKMVNVLYYETTNECAQPSSICTVNSKQLRLSLQVMRGTF